MARDGAATRVRRASQHAGERFTRSRHRRAGVVLLAALWLSGAGTAELFLFRGEFIYIIPRALSDEMTRFAGRADWKHFPEHTRYVDADGDGENDYVAAAFGATTGHGVQVRYRLRREADGSLRLGSWYWGVITAPEGDRLTEQFNP